MTATKKQVKAWEARISWHENAKQQALESAPEGMTLWGIYETAAHAKRDAKHYKFSGWIALASTHDGGPFFALYIPR